MQLIGKVHTFNTGRMYAANGQEIRWAVVQLEPERNYEPKLGTRQAVAFSDTARGIAGFIELHLGNLDLIDDRWVLAAYDDHHYQHMHGNMAEQFLRPIDVTGCTYNLLEPPLRLLVNANSLEGTPSQLQCYLWSNSRLPKLGEQVKVTCNSMGPGEVVSYFTEQGYLGVRVKLDAEPDWHRKQCAGTPNAGHALVFGAEIEVLL